MRFGKTLCMVYNTSKMQSNDIYYLQKVMYIHQEFFLFDIREKSRTFAYFREIVGKSI